MSVTTLYTSDSHLLHRNIIRFCQRPFPDLTSAAMDLRLLTGLRAAEALGARIVHGGDLTFHLAKVRAQYGPIFQHPERHLLVVGNHDNCQTMSEVAIYRQEFGTIAGVRKTWMRNSLVVMDTLDGTPVRVLVSHLPQKDLPADIDFNVYGHYHNNIWTTPEWHYEHDPWLFTMLRDPRYLNASVELTDYAPASLEALVAQWATQPKLAAPPVSPGVVATES